MRDLTSISRGTRAFLAGTALAGVALLAACAGDEATPTPASTAAKAATAASTPKTAATSAATGSPSAASPAASATTVRIGDTSLGKVLVDERGMTLYTFKNDPPNEGKSVCNGNCASIWPPVPAPASGNPSKPADAAGAIVVITRDDGSKQVAYAGQPLYRYTPDTAAGETKGEGVGGNWFVARP
jgi:predicted lipoprotein with Yx(FWY)xxD motif